MILVLSLLSLTEGNGGSLALAVVACDCGVGSVYVMEWRFEKGDTGGVGFWNG